MEKFQNFTFDVSLPAYAFRISQAEDGSHLITIRFYLPRLNEIQVKEVLIDYDIHSLGFNFCKMRLIKLYPVGEEVNHYPVDSFWCGVYA